MDLELPPERELLRKASAQYLHDRWPPPRVRAAAERREPVDRGYLAEAADLGWFAMFIAEDDGGGSLSGDPAADATVIAEVRGAVLAPGPFAAVNAAAALITRAGSAGQRARLLPPVAAGSSHVLVAAGGDALWGDHGVTARPGGTGLELSGSLVIIDGPSAATHVVVVPGDPAQTAVVPLDRPGVRRVAMDCLDLTRRADRVVLDGVRLEPDLVLHATAGDIAQARAVAVTLAAAETVGALRRLFEMTTAYAKDRVAFGRPIGSFQAVKHLMADMSLTVEQARALSAAAVRTLDDERPFAAEVASMARVFLAERGARLAQDCLQVHGGIGFSWEHDLHLYLRRIAADAAMFGTADWHRELILAAHHEELEPIS